MEISVNPDGYMRDERIHREALQSSEIISTANAQAIELNRVFVRTYREMLARSEAGSNEEKLSSSRAALVALLYRTKTGLTIMDVASGLDMTPQGASKLVEVLEKEGWVRRAANPNDARSTLVELTESGTRDAGTLLSASYARLTQNWSVLTPQEQEVLIHLMTKVRVHLKARTFIRNEAT